MPSSLTARQLYVASNLKNGNISILVHFMEIFVRKTVLNQMFDNVILKKSGGKKSMKECRRGNMLPHGVKRLMNKVTRFPNDRNAGPPLLFWPSWR